ncbi:MAG TPA: hypothetical protein ACFYD6_00105 [Candidatus Brocadiia bacterium]|nr:hypothetical protein [Candidatus Brocadiales bacterium]
MSSFKISFIVVGILAICLCATNARIAAADVLNPDMAPEAGTWDKPAAKIGKTPAEVWTGTTIEAAVKGVPLKGEAVTVVGEIVDMSCYLQLGKHGAKHKDCAQKCATHGEPIGLLTKNGDVYILIPEEHHPRRDVGTKLRETLIKYMASIVEVTGTSTLVEGIKTIYVQGYVE